MEYIILVPFTLWVVIIVFLIAFVAFAEVVVVVLICQGMSMHTWLRVVIFSIVIVVGFKVPQGGAGCRDLA